MPKICQQSELGEADLTLVIFLAGVSDLMLPQRVWCFESFAAELAMMWPLIRVIDMNMLFCRFCRRSDII